MRAKRPKRETNVYYPGKTEHLQGRITPLGRQVLAHVQQRTGRSVGDIVEYLLREHGRSLEFG